MRLIVHELKTELYQEITVGEFPIFLAAVRPHLLVFNRAGLGSAELTIQVQDSRGKKIAESEPLAVADLSAAAYAHKYYRFNVTAALRAGQTYRIALRPGGGYSFSEAAYIAWCNGWDLRRNNASYEVTDFNAPLDMELWHRRGTKLGVA